MLKMDSVKLLTIFMLAISLDFTSAQGKTRTNEVKQGQTFSLCGDTFVMAWKYMCKYKYQLSQRKKGRTKRSIQRK